MHAGILALFKTTVMPAGTAIPSQELSTVPPKVSVPLAPAVALLVTTNMKAEPARPRTWPFRVIVPLLRKSKLLVPLP